MLLENNVSAETEVEFIRQDSVMTADDVSTLMSRQSKDRFLDIRDDPFSKSRVLNQRVNVEKEQAKDLSFFKSRIPDDHFIENIFNSRSTDLWIPEQDDLLITGVIHEIVSVYDQ